MTDQKHTPGPRFRCGDAVRHVPSGETWRVAYDDGTHLAWAGWPDGRARSQDCELVRACTDAEHRAEVERWREAGDGSRRAAVLRMYADSMSAAKEGAGDE